MILTPDGLILHAMAGYVPPKDLVWELNQALQTWRAVQKTVRGDAKQRVVQRQDAIERAYARRGGAKARWVRSSAEKDRAFMRAYPLITLGAFRTSLLTRGAINKFGYSVGDEGDGQTPTTPLGRSGKPGRGGRARGGGGGLLGRAR